MAGDIGLPRYQRGVKICSIVILIIGIISCIASIFVIVIGPIVGFAATSPDVSIDVATDTGFSPAQSSQGLALLGVLLTVMGIVSLVSAAIDIVMGALGLRGAKDPSKIGPFWVLAIIGLVISSASAITSIVMTAVGGADLGGDLLNELISDGFSIVFSILCVFYATKVREISRSMGAHYSYQA